MKIGETVEVNGLIYRATKSKKENECDGCVTTSLSDLCMELPTCTAHEGQPSVIFKEVTNNKE